MHPENTGVWQLLMIVKNQFRCSMAGLYGIDMQAVIETAREIGEELGVSIDYLFFRKIRAFETEIIKHAVGAADGKEKGSCSAEKINQCREIYGEYFESTCKKCEEMKSAR